MDPLGAMILLVALVLSVLAFRVSSGMGWHWGSAIFMAVIPLASTFFLGVIGLLGSAVFVGGLYKASAG